SQPFAGRRVVIACGALIAPLLARTAAGIGERTGARIKVRGIANSVFGERVNVSGLLCGKDYASALAGVEADCFILPRASLDYFGRQFLDSMPVEELQAQLGAPLAFASQWSEVVQVLECGPQRAGRNRSSNGAFWSEQRVRLPRGAAWVRG
ncbi:MAG: DUF512 domain-containing protein, partial [Tepidiformaceae bacterium]